MIRSPHAFELLWRRYPTRGDIASKIVDTWTSTAGILVKHGIKTWDVYLEYSRESWSSLRDTPQTRKFTAYFLPKIIYCGVDIYQSNRSTFSRLLDAVVWLNGSRC